MIESLGRYMAWKQRTKDLPSIAVTREEFIKMMMEAGKSEDEARFQANIAEGLGSSTELGGQMVSIKKETTNDQVSGEDGGGGPVREGG